MPATRKYVIIIFLYMSFSYDFKRINKSKFVNKKKEDIFMRLKSNQKQKVLDTNEKYNEHEMF